MAQGDDIGDHQILDVVDRDRAAKCPRSGRVEHGHTQLLAHQLRADPPARDAVADQSDDRRDRSEATSRRRQFQLAPTALLWWNATLAANTQDPGNRTGKREGHEGSTQCFHRGASWNRTSDLHIISVTL